MGSYRPGLADLMAAVGVAAWYHVHLRPRMYTWGARDDEIAAVLPGDDIVDAPGPRTTRAVTVDAPPAQVWPWLAQIGEDRGGFYSYSLLERAVGADMHNAATVHPEWQQLDIGDTVWLARRYGPAARQIVAAVEPGSHLVLVSPADFARLDRGQKATGCWSFTLRPDGEQTRLVARGTGGSAGHFWFDVPHFVMERKMLRGIARRAARSRHASHPDLAGIAVLPQP